MREPPDLAAGVRRYLTFNQLDVDHVTKRQLDWPPCVAQVGVAKSLAYRSDKWEGRNHDYIHEHDETTKVYQPAFMDGRRTPQFIAASSTLVRLGSLIHLAFENYEGIITVREPSFDLCCIPSGRALVIVGRKIEFLVWGTALRVEDRGVVG